jgi:enterochelin esterase-like enzyme
MEKRIYRTLVVAALCLSTLLSCAGAPKAADAGAESRVEKLTFFSASLEKEMPFNIYLPRNYRAGQRYPVLYLLHGYKDKEDCWMPNLQLKAAADRLISEGRIKPLIIVMPLIDDSFGINTDPVMNLSMKFTAGRYEDYLYKDLVTYIDKHYSTVRNREGRYIGGLSMGGFAALHLAFTHPDLFSRVGGHSPAFIDDLWIYPNIEARIQRDPQQIAINNDLRSLRVYLDCGDTDSFKFYVGCGLLFSVLQAKGVPSEYHLNPGGHTKEYWMENSEAYLLFYAGI